LAAAIVTGLHAWLAACLGVSAAAYLRARSSATKRRITRCSREQGGTNMDENRIAGTARNVGGKAQEGLGRAAGDANMEAKGVANQISGAAQDLYGQARDSAADMAGSARESAANLDGAIRGFVETQPYTAVLIALGLGWLFGRMHRPL
jgi:uncharacterized protein YjbJ (UPF0337 family)